MQLAFLAVLFLAIILAIVRSSGLFEAGIVIVGVGIYLIFDSQGWNILIAVGAYILILVGLRHLRVYFEKKYSRKR